MFVGMERPVVGIGKVGCLAVPNVGVFVPIVNYDRESVNANANQTGYVVGE